MREALSQWEAGAVVSHPKTCFMVLPPVRAKLLSWVSGPYTHPDGKRTASIWLTEDVSPAAEQQYLLVPDDGGPHEGEVAI